MSWGALFERAAAVDADEAAVGEALARRRSGGGEPAGDDGQGTGDEGGTTVAPADDGHAGHERLARVVADADVLAADLLCGGSAREALDLVRAHDWVTLVASEPLLGDAAAVVAALADDGLADDWRAAARGLAEVVEHPAGDQPALACAYRGGAVHVLSLDEALRSARAGAAIRARVETSVKHPDAFARLFDPAAMFEVVVGGDYPGPDRDPRG